MQIDLYQREKKIVLYFGYNASIMAYLVYLMCKPVLNVVNGMAKLLSGVLPILSTFLKQVYIFIAYLLSWVVLLNVVIWMFYIQITDK